MISEYDEFGPGFDYYADFYDGWGDPDHFIQDEEDDRAQWQDTEWRLWDHERATTDFWESINWITEGGDCHAVVYYKGAYGWGEPPF